MGKLLIWICIIIIAIPIVRYLLSFLSEYVKLIISNPSEISHRIKDGWKDLLQSLKNSRDTFIYSFKRIRKAYLTFIEKWYWFKGKVRRFFKWRPSDEEKPEKAEEKTGAKDNFKLFSTKENRESLKIKTALSDNQAKKLSKLNVYIPKSIFKKLQLDYVPARLYKMCESMDGLKATNKYLNSINVSLDNLTESNDARLRLNDILELIMIMEGFAISSELSDEPFYALLEKRDVTLSELEENIALYRKASELKNAVNSDAIIFYDFVHKFKPNTARKIKRWGSINPKILGRIYREYQRYYELHLEYQKLNKGILKIFERIEEIVDSSDIEFKNLIKNYADEIEKIKNGTIRNPAEWQNILRERGLSAFAFLRKKSKSDSKSDDSKADDKRDSSDSGTRDKDTSSDSKKYSGKKTFSNAKEWFDYTDISGSGDTKEGCLKVLGLDVSEQLWKNVKAAHRRLVKRWHPDRLPDGTSDEEVKQSSLVFGEITKSFNRLKDNYAEHFK